MNYLDIETATGYKDFESADQRTKECWAMKMRGEVETLRTEKGDLLLDPYFLLPKLYSEKAALYSEFNKIVCVTLGTVVTTEGVSRMSIKSSSSDDEIDILRDVAKALTGRYDLCAHNGKGFDFPMLSRKYMIHGLPMPELFNNGGKKPWDIPLIDTQEMWKFGDLRYTVSLDQLAMVFNLPSPKAQMHGSQVSEYYWSGRLKEIVKYCELDVQTLINVHRRMTGLSIVTELHGYDGKDLVAPELFP